MRTPIRDRQVGRRALPSVMVIRQGPQSTKSLSYSAQTALFRPVLLTARVIVSGQEQSGHLTPKSAEDIISMDIEISGRGASDDGQPVQGPGGPDAAGGVTAPARRREDGRGVGRPVR